MSEGALTPASGRAATILGDRRTWWIVGTLVLIALIAASSLDLIPINVVQVIVFGLQAGAVYSLVALGLALVYKATRVLNFAQGELGTVPAFLAYSIMVGFDISGATSPDKGRFLVATIAAIALGALLSVLVNTLVVQRLAEASQVTSLVATVGVALLFTAAEVIVFQAKARPFPQYVTGSPCWGADTGQGAAFGLCPLTIGGSVVPWHTIVVVVVLAIAATLLALFFRTRAGVALLATAQEPFAAQLQGVSVRSMATVAWAAAGALGAIGGLLGAGNFEQLTPGMITATYLIPAFTGAVLGGITSMVGAVVGGLLLGITVSFANTAVLEFDLSSVLPGPPQIAVLLVLLLVLLFRPRGLLGKEA